MNLFTLMHALNVMDALDNDDQAKARERERLFGAAAADAADATGAVSCL